MLTYVVRRILYSIPVLVVASFLVFTLVTLAANPLGYLHSNPRITPEQIKEIAHAKGLDQNVVFRYWTWVKEAVTHKFGNSLFTGDPIWPDLKRVFMHTLVLVTITLIVAVVIGVAVGIYSAVRQYSVFDYGATVFSYIGFAMPVFWLALILQVIFTDVYLHWHVRVFYTAQLNSPGASAWSLDRLQHLALPVMTLSLLFIAQYSRYMRASMLEVIHADFTRTARAKGLTERRVVMRHVLRNSLIPVVTQIGVDFGALLGGVIVTEQVYTLDGMGHYYITALQGGDPYPVMAWLVVTGALVIFFNLVADITYGFLDPRIRYD
jgi:peptide/nickel transport system permease protein